MTHNSTEGRNANRSANLELRKLSGQLVVGVEHSNCDISPSCQLLQVASSPVWAYILCIQISTLRPLMHSFILGTTQQQPSLDIVTNSSSFLCTDEYLVVGEDFITFEVELSGNNSDYTYTVFDGPRFQIQQLVTENGNTELKSDNPICQPFLAPVDGFCVKKDITGTTGCSCELVGPQVYWVKAVYRIQNVNETRVLLLWPSLSGNLNVSYYLPEIQGECG
ncbi:hypothetical protein PoB_004319200 [Plakobranchus ocellatus]|uniref:Phlebovirus glycoprotein G2 fusion domain-containing protein n=1 Tax=Plakobranchus ocellatus TaxID=259542 RepID=A0AAV4BB99_9GAST|nr:hypothetical protein PoB_004319200 [Plakobranchus ocellatus]